jgi:hypothetical protein
MMIEVQEASRDILVLIDLESFHSSCLEREEEGRHAQRTDSGLNSLRGRAGSLGH